MHNNTNNSDRMNTVAYKSASCGFCKEFFADE